MPLIPLVVASLVASQRLLFHPLRAPVQQPAAFAPRLLVSEFDPGVKPGQAWAQIESSGAAPGASWTGWRGALILATAGIGAASSRAVRPRRTSVAHQLSAELAQHEEHAAATALKTLGVLAVSGKAGKSRASVKMDLGTDAKDFFDKVASWFQSLTSSEEETPEVVPAEAPEAPEAPAEAPEAADAAEATDEKTSMLAVSGKVDKSRANVKMDLGTDAKEFFEKATNWLQNLTGSAKGAESPETPEAPDEPEAPEAPEAPAAAEATD